MPSSCSLECFWRFPQAPHSGQKQEQFKQNFCCTCNLDKPSSISLILIFTPAIVRYHIIWLHHVYYLCVCAPVIHSGVWGTLVLVNIHQTVAHLLTSDNFCLPVKFVSTYSKSNCSYAEESMELFAPIFNVQMLWISIALDLNEALIFPLIDMHSQTQLILGTLAGQMPGISMDQWNSDYQASQSVKQLGNSEYRSVFLKAMELPRADCPWQWQIFSSMAVNSIGVKWGTLENMGLCACACRSVCLCTRLKSELCLPDYLTLATALQLRAR